ncbi:cobalt-zinc-cadmium resistance protein [Duganella vulcania]|jgi:hypothetical protein|uniref:Cobalt-zinc-cadmium resistance protein n=1 Tax=Duganella vulcania TaxID=2692166 RepID=A0A845GL14_9BURK|nr:cobalt-zinc-cadmium resistance protein [Duganella vulcania]MYM94122.1 cobalt-zinc-cadmium resistance protein [Duganella vulcania]
MKRLLLIFLLCVVPFQFAWATAGAYCQHETGAAPKHFGHHAHHHQANAEKTETSYKVGKLHPDCGSCHGMSFALFQEPLLAQSIVATGTNVPAAKPEIYTSHIPDGLRRPDRRFSF